MKVEGSGVLRPMREAEFEHWHVLSQADYIDDLMQNFLYSRDKAEQEAADVKQRALPQGMNTSQQYFRIYEQDGQNLGYLWFSLENQAAFLMDLMLLPLFQGQGHGKRMMRALIDELTLLGTQEIELRVGPDNQRALRLYEQCGFRLTGLDMHLCLKGDGGPVN